MSVSVVTEMTSFIFRAKDAGITPEMLQNIDKIEIAKGFTLHLNDRYGEHPFWFYYWNHDKYFDDRVVSKIEDRIREACKPLELEIVVERKKYDNSMRYCI